MFPKTFGGKHREVYLDGKKLQINQPKDAIRAGVPLESAKSG
jgi:hypothetical protein